MLLLCTANQCRSPMAEVLLRHHLERAGATATVSSAGLLEGGRPATPEGVAAMAERGLDLGAHRSRRLDAELVRRADLVVGMSREHVREAAVLAPGALDRSFTLRELVAAGERVGPRRPDEPLAAWLARAGSGRRREDLIGVGHDDRFDVADPVGQGRARYDATAALLDDLLGRLVAVAWPTPGAQERSA